MTVTTNDRGQQNLFAKEPQMYVTKTDAERYGYESYAERAEKLNGRTAMLGFVAAVVSYAFSGSVFLWCVRILMTEIYFYRHDSCFLLSSWLHCRTTSETY